MGENSLHPNSPDYIDSFDQWFESADIPEGADVWDEYIKQCGG